ncbi:toll/interleukin-1 receptor domain-containing protein [Variovorax rhizosphaerae]|uniref:Toll/interleukin-1 receptor domain-containing protein n=1 Tax=Variovorax rhizosphaerae TaxID=1836200 RepID=A0ABU8WYP5_9BURK
MAQVFISYKRNAVPDHALAREIAVVLRRDNNVFIDEDILAGERWSHRIEVELESADFFVVLLSRKSIESPMVVEEVRRASTSHRLTNRPILLPIRIAFEELLPYELEAHLQPIQQIVWNNDSDTATVSETLRKRIAAAKFLKITDFDLQSESSAVEKENAQRRSIHKIGVAGAMILALLIVTLLYQGITIKTPNIDLGTANATYRYVGDDMECRPNDTCRERNSKLRSLILPTPNAVLYAGPELAENSVVQLRLKSYWPLFLFNKRLAASDPTRDGALQVGITSDKPIGWIYLKDGLPWSSRLLVAFRKRTEVTHPPDTFIFRSLNEAKTAMESPEVLEGIRNRISIGFPPASVLGTIPGNITEIEQQFYVVPIVSVTSSLMPSGIKVSYVQIPIKSQIVTVFDAYVAASSTTGWVANRLPTDPSSSVLDVRILLRRIELRDLLVQCQGIVKNAKSGAITPREMFRLASAISISVSKGLSFESIRPKEEQAAMLASLGFKSMFAGMEEDQFENLSAGQVLSLTERLESLTRTYEQLLKSHEGWVRLNGDDVPEQYVYALQLDKLP